MTAPYSKQAVIGYDNAFTASGTLSASSDPEGGEKENAVDGLTYDFWQPEGAGPHTLTMHLDSAQTVNYLAIAAHNLPDVAGTVQLHGSNDGSAWTDLSGVKTPADSVACLYRFTGGSYSYFRLTMTGDGAYLGVLNAGAITVLDDGIFVGAAPPTLNRNNTILNATSEGGAFLGRSRIRTGNDFKLNLSKLDPAWVRATWDEFAEFAEESPFFFAWRNTDYPLEVMYAWSAADASASYEAPGFMKAELSLAGLL